ncbi:PQQ-binding-like beta-propeller repeat protein [Salarchaeum sp. III]|uniref:outer membrane protein assembly factor BamB family protein n=1 Tax=Salarchaeum sp. III TaxID=3107927 RepID=UPI002ED97673
MDRREFLKAGVVAGVAASAGCASSTEPAPVLTGDPVPGWRMYGRDPARTYTAPVKGEQPESTPLWSKYGNQDVILEDPVIASETAYVAYGRSSMYRETSYIEALDLETGRRNWRTPLDANRIGTPLVAPDVNRVFVNAAPRTGDTGVLYALDAQSGAIVATRTVDDDGVGPILRTRNGILSCRGGSLVRTVRRYDAGALDETWSRSDVSLPVVGGGTAYMTTSADTLVAVDSASGDTDWEVESVHTAALRLTESGIHVLLGKTLQSFDGTGERRRTLEIDPGLDPALAWPPVVTESTLVLHYYWPMEIATSLISVPHQGSDTLWRVVSDRTPRLHIGLGDDFIASSGAQRSTRIVNARTRREEYSGHLGTPVAATTDYLITHDIDDGLSAYRMRDDTT